MWNCSVSRDAVNGSCVVSPVVKEERGVACCESG